MSNLYFKSLNAYPNLIAGMTNRIGGVSEGYFASNNMGILSNDPDPKAIENVRAMIYALGIKPWKIAASRQIHGTRCAIVGHEPPENLFETGYSIYDNTDALATNVPGVLLMTFYGDCVPILIYDPEHAAVGLCHSGWKGTSVRAVSNLVDSMVKAYNSNPSSLKAVVMPAAGVCCYEVGFEFLNLFVEHSKFLIPHGNKFRIDLKAINAEILRSCGIPETSIEISPLCTLCDAQFFSNRRDGGHTGRMTAFAFLRPEMG